MNSTQKTTTSPRIEYGQNEMSCSSPKLNGSEIYSETKNITNDIQKINEQARFHRSSEPVLENATCRPRSNDTFEYPTLIISNASTSALLTQSDPSNEAITHRSHSPLRTLSPDILHTSSSGIIKVKRKVSREIPFNGSATIAQFFDEVKNPPSQNNTQSEESVSDDTTKEVKNTSQAQDILQPKLEPAKNRTVQGQARLNESRESLNKTKSMKSQAQSIEEMSKLCKDELKKTIVAVNTSKRSMKSEYVANLKIIGLPTKLPCDRHQAYEHIEGFAERYREDFYKCANDNREASYNLGNEILKPEIGVDDKKKKLIEEFLNEGIKNPKICAEEMWRSIGSTKLYDWRSDQPLIDGTLSIVNSNTVNANETEAEKEKREEEEERLIHLNNSQNMGKLLNLLFQHVSQSKDELIPAEDFGSSLIHAGLLGSSIPKRLQNKEQAGLHKEATQTMQLILGLGYQKLYTHPATWTIPKEFQTVGGTDEELIVSEYRSNTADVLKPFQYAREISITMKEDGGLEYLLCQPITFRDKINDSILGTCRVQTTFLFKSDMSLKSQYQEVKAASISK